MSGRKVATRRRIDELKVRYARHPEFRDIYVEGASDKFWVEWVLSRSGVSNVVVYDVDTVFIPPDMLAKHGFHEGEDGKKERVVTLAYELQNHVAHPAQVTCIADRDYDILLGRNYASPLLLMTDYCCQEAYLLNEQVMEKFLRVVIGCSVSPQTFLNNLFEVLQPLHLFRAANLALRWGMGWLAPERACRVEGDLLKFQHDDFVYKYLNSGSRLSQKQEFLDKCDELRARMSDNPLNHASKDHLFDLLTLTLPRFCKEPAMHQPEYVARALRGCIEYAQLASQPMYAAILGRFREKTA